MIDPKDDPPIDDKLDDVGPAADRTVFIAPGEAAPVETQPPPAPPSAPAATVVALPQDTPVAAPPPPPAPMVGAGRVQVGAVLNHIYEVKRFIARGGMGEVYEGANVNSDERVAIKVMLPHLAADPKIQAMFRKEARTLTRLSHPAVVQYRVLAQEPVLDVFYIVTEFIDGSPLSDLVGDLQPSADELRALTRRLAEGLGAAHALGAIHRDMSPDNVLLPGRDLAGAKVIDFGIAKDLDPANATIVGDGFAGKLGYVAPEQFGDYGREVGPWTDVYSLALVILSLAAGRQIDMGATLVDAIDKRRKGPDLSPLPEGLRPVFARMLAPDPAERFRSMAEVVDALDSPAAAPARPTTKPPEAAKPSAGAPTLFGLPRGVAIAGGAAAAVVAALALALVLWPRAPATEAKGPGAATAPAAPKAEQARLAIEAILPSVECTWLDLDRADGGPGGVSVALSGVAGSTAQAQAAVARAAEGSGAALAEVDMSAVAPVTDAVCDPLNAFRSVRAETSQSGRRLTTAQRTFELAPQADRDNGVFGRAVIGMDVNDPNLDFALFGIEPSGKIDPILPSRAELEDLAKQGSSAIAVMGPSRWRLNIDNDHSGWSGLLLITGKGPFDAALLTSARGPDWRQRFEAAAKAGGWRTEMVWYRVVDEIPN